MIISELMLERMKYQLLGFILKEIRLFLQLLIIPNLQMMTMRRMRILFGIVKMAKTMKKCL